MSLRIDAKFSSGNVAAWRIQQNEASARIFFSAHPCGSAEALWFYFRIMESSPETPHPEMLTITLEFVKNLTGCETPSDLYPVFRGDGQGWNRVRTGTVFTGDDGQTSVSWVIPYPAPTTELAMCYPYGRAELKTLMQKSKGHWDEHSIGLSQDGRPIARISNTIASAPAAPGIYLIARQYAGEVPGSWVLDGILQHFSRTNEKRMLAWAVPLPDINGIERGHYGRGAAPTDFGQAWGSPPLRYETRAIQADLVEWQKRCSPALILDLQASGGTESSGVFCYLTVSETPNAAARDSEKWANVLRDALGSEYAAADFKRVRSTHPQTGGMALDDYARQVMAIPALTLVTPYALCGKTLLAPKHYREIGSLIARAIIQRIRKQ